MQADFTYKNLSIAAIPQREGFLLRVTEKDDRMLPGFDWYFIKELKGRYLKLKEVVKIRAEKKQQVFGKWYGVSPINL